MTNDWLRDKTNFLVGPQEPLPANLKRRKLAWFRNDARYDSLSTKTIVQAGTLQGGRCTGQQIALVVSMCCYTRPKRNHYVYIYIMVSSSVSREPSFPVLILRIVLNALTHSWSV